MMKNRRSIRSFLLLCFLSLSAPSVVWAQVVREKPGIDGSSSFAVVIDANSLWNCRAEVEAYKQVLEGEGLPTYIVSAQWQSPEAVREAIIDLYRNAALEGVVFIGDVPIAMITKAQHLTSAFKMDERKYALFDVSVPSDRFYDDFDLSFIPVRDSSDHPYYYYTLAPDSEQYIECDIYSGRIKPQTSNGDPYEQIRHFLRKAVARHNEQNRFDTFVSFTGDGSYSNSLTAWVSEKGLLNEQFGDTFTRRNSAKFLRHSMEPFMKTAVIKELRRDDLDMMTFHEHGVAERQYLTGTPSTDDPQINMEVLQMYLRSLVRRNKDADDPYERAAGFAAKWGVDSTWYIGAFDPETMRRDSLFNLRTGIILEDVDAINPNARFVIFDACYNGDFREGDYIAGKYIFADGKCVSTFANSVNVLQDKSAFDLLGLLGGGMRIGAWAKNVNILESHITGDPTFRFTPSSDFGADINRMTLEKDPAFWLAKLSDPHPDIVNLAAIRLFEAGHNGISDILFGLFDGSPYAVVRYNALALLERLNDANFKKALMKATGDDFEFIRRIAVTRMGRTGDNDYIPCLIDAFINDYYSARVVFNVSRSLLCFDRGAVTDAIEARYRQLEGKNVNADKYRAALLKILERDPAAELVESLDDRDSKWRTSMIAFLKNEPRNQAADRLIEFICDGSEDELHRTLMVESLGWFRLSIHNPRIVAACKGLLDDPATPDAMRPELIRTISKLQSPK